MPKECNVCFGTPGKYPVINRFGQQLYEINCPECYGRGEIMTEAEISAAASQHKPVTMTRA